MENNCQHGESCLRGSSSTLLQRGEGFKWLTGMEMWRWRGAAVSTLLEPNPLVQSCVKNVRDLFQALSRCGFTSVNPFTHRSSAVRLPHVTGSARCLACARPAVVTADIGCDGTFGAHHTCARLWGEAPTKHRSFLCISGCGSAPTCLFPSTKPSLSLSKLLQCF